MVNLKAFPLETRRRKGLLITSLVPNTVLKFLVSAVGIENKSMNIKKYLPICFRHVQN